MQRLKKLKTKPWQRQLTLGKIGAASGLAVSTQMMGSLFLSPKHRKLKNKAILSEQARYFANELGQLKGSAVKVGQLMALYGEHILSEEVIQALRSLEENTVALEWQSIEPELRRQLGDSFDQFEIEREPIGAASLAQVHKARHKVTNTWFCFKIQYPGVAQSIDSDLNTIAKLLKISRLVTKSDAFSAWLDEIRQLLHFEIDYQREAALTQKFADRLHQHAILKVPTIYQEYCTKTLIVMSFESGYVVTDPLVQQLPLDRKNRLASSFLTLFLDELFVWGELQTDPNFGNYRVHIDPNGDDKIVLLDFGAVLTYSDDFLSPVKAMLLGAIAGDRSRIKAGAIALGIMNTQYPDSVHEDFAGLCQLLVEPFLHEIRDVPKEAINAKGQYCWSKSALPKRAAKYATQSAMSQYFAMPPKEFMFLSRKLLGVYSFMSALEAEFNPEHLLKAYPT